MSPKRSVLDKRHVHWSLDAGYLLAAFILIPLLITHLDLVPLYLRDHPPTPPDLRLDLNTASLDQIESLPGIGPEKAQQILKKRPFRTLKSLDRVPGIGPVLLDRLTPLIRLSPPPHKPSR